MHYFLELKLTSVKYNPDKNNSTATTIIELKLTNDDINKILEMSTNVLNEVKETFNPDKSS